MEQCACEIHTQQQLYLMALKMYLKAMHPKGECECACVWCKDGCGLWQRLCDNLGDFSELFACDKVNFFRDDPGGGTEFMGRKPACVNLKCADCGFDNDGGIPRCSAWDTWGERRVGWIRFGDLVQADGSVVKKQQLPVEGTLNELFSEFKIHTAKVT